MRNVALLLVLLTAGLAAGCGGGSEKDSEGGVSEAAKAACTGSALSATPNLPASFPMIEQDKLTYTKQSKLGPTDVVEGYFNGDVEEAHDEFQKELKAAGYDILFDEVEAPN